MLKKGLENNYEDSNRCKHSKPAIDIFKAGRGRNTPKTRGRVNPLRTASEFSLIKV